MKRPLRKLECSWPAPISIDGLNKEDRHRITQIGLTRWLEELEIKKTRTQNANINESEDKVSSVTVPIAESSVTTAETPVVVAKAKKNLLESATILRFERKWPSLSKTVSKTDPAVDIKADRSRVHVTKDLFDSPELKRLFSYDARIDAFLDVHCLPFPLMRGWRLLPLDLFNETEAALTAHHEGRLPLIEAAYNVYEKDIESAKVFLNKLFDPSDYVPKEEFKSKFIFRWQYLRFGEALNIEQINKDIAQREANKVQAQWIEASEAVQQLLRIQMQELVANMTDRLAPGAEGKKKIFRDSLVSNMNDFLKTFDARNLTEDGELKRLVDQVRALTDGVDPETLRTNDGIRDSVQQGFALVKTQLDQMITTAPLRSITFED